MHRLEVVGKCLAATEPRRAPKIVKAGVAGGHSEALGVRSPEKVVYLWRRVFSLFILAAS